LRTINLGLAILTSGNVQLEAMIIECGYGNQVVIARKHNNRQATKRMADL